MKVQVRFFAEGPREAFVFKPTWAPRWQKTGRRPRRDWTPGRELLRVPGRWSSTELALLRSAAGLLTLRASRRGQFGGLRLRGEGEDLFRCSCYENRRLPVACTLVTTTCFVCETLVKLVLRLVRAMMMVMMMMRCPKMAPRWPKMDPRWAQRGPKIAPRWPQDASRCLEIPILVQRTST